MSDFPLTHEQQSIFDLIENTDGNVLIHGKPGVGKSVLIRALRETGSKHYALAAPTGLAALNIGGKTLHSLFGIAPSEGAFAPDFNNFTKNQSVHENIYHQCTHLIIDEVSMVRADMLDYIDRELQFIKGSDLPFGGIQLIVVGDFFQLPPVTKPRDKKELKEYGYESEFAFDAHSFKDFKLASLNTVMRQSDKAFLDVLHAARTGDLKPKHLVLLNKQVGRCDDFRIQLAAINSQADMINAKQLSLLKTEEQTYSAFQSGRWPAVPVEPQLRLKVGAQIMIKKNNSDKVPSINGVKSSPASGKIVNGTIGKIVELPTAEHDYMVVEIEDGTTHNIYRQRWELHEKYKQDGKWLTKTIASYEQLPFQLAWAISMHKSQGQSFDKVHIDSQRLFAAGQMYVALSRCRSLEGVSLQRQITADDFWADKNVLRFNNTIYNGAKK